VSFRRHPGEGLKIAGYEVRLPEAPRGSQRLPQVRMVSQDQLDSGRPRCDSAHIAHISERCKSGKSNDVPNGIDGQRWSRLVMITGNIQ
jgi:hypothetical protein